MMHQINMKTKYQTKSGHPVRILCNDKTGKYPVVALISIRGIEELALYTARGCNSFSNNNDSSDLQPAPEKIEMWVRRYSNGRLGMVKERRDLCERTSHTATDLSFEIIKLTGEYIPE